MINLVDLRYVRMGTEDVDAAADFATEIMGLETVARDNGALYLRGDDRDHNVCYFQGDPKDHTVGFELADAAELEKAEAELRANGVEVRKGTAEECAARRVMEFINFKDPTGNSIDLVLRPFASGRRYFASRDAGIDCFSHIGLKTSDAPRDEKFWTSLFNIHVNDWINHAALMTFDDVHHRIALFPTDEPGVQHINFQVHTHDDVMRSYYFLRDRQVRIAFGPGRHPVSRAMFLYFDGPDGVVYEYSCGVPSMKDLPDFRPRQWPWQQWSLCMWGAIPDIREFN